ncbi:MAG: hypothetical protein IH991_03640 [Planctomycetes bacterium]|nr:hypothetical protein [Planctomycetota bacterium]
MNECLQALLANSIDYAGVFPPAELSLQDAVHECSRFQSQADSWMLGSFICPAAKIEQFYSLSESFPSRQAVSIVARATSNAESALEDLQRLVKAVEQFQESHSDFVKVVALELKPPFDVLDGSPDAHPAVFLEAVMELLHSSTLADQVFCELQLSKQSVDAVSLIASTSSGLLLGLKLRTGGLEPAAFPTVDEVASFIAACRDASVFWKATAGLHQPLRHYDSKIGAWHHGFLNLFAAAVFAQIYNLSEHEIREVLENEMGSAFRFGPEYLCWNDFKATKEQIESARLQSLVSFGSCSFDEPREGLQSLGLL